MKQYWDILMIFIKSETRSKLQYRGALWADIIFYIFGYGTQFVLTFLLVDKFDSIQGWTKYQVMLLYAMTMLTYTLACVFLRGPSDHVPRKIRTGEFDQTLTKPLNPLLYEITASFSAYYLVHVLLGIGMVVLCLVLEQVAFTPANLLMLILTIMGGTMIQGGILLLFSSFSFFLIGENPLSYSLFIALRLFAEYPLSIFPRFLQVSLTLILPFAFISFFPAQYFLNANDFLSFPSFFQYLSPVVGGIVLFVSGKVWLWGIKHYQSSGT